jgi:type I restriction enzyme, S subunit
MVVRAIPDKALPEFLPFLMMSDRFMSRAVEISVGSLSPTINWTTLKPEEFALPPLDQQRRIAEILWAVDEVEQDQISTRVAVDAYRKTVTESTCDELASGPCKRLADLWPRSPDSGCSVPPSPFDTGHFVLSLAALSTGGYVSNRLKSVEATAAMLGARLSKGDFLISRSNTQELVGLVGIFDEDRRDVSFPDTMMRMHVDEGRILKPFLEAFLLSDRGRKHMMRSAAGTSGSMKKINRTTLGQCLVPTPPTAVQSKVLLELAAIRSVGRETASAADVTRLVKTAMTNAFFGSQR